MIYNPNLELDIIDHSIIYNIGFNIYCILASHKLLHTSSVNLISSTTVSGFVISYNSFFYFRLLMSLSVPSAEVFSVMR